MKKFSLKSVRAKLFITLCICIGMIIGFFIIINNTIIETLFYYTKKNASLFVYDFVNENIPKDISEENMDTYKYNLEKIEVSNNFEIVIINEQGNVIYSTYDKNFMEDFNEIPEINYDIDYSIFNKSDFMLSNDKVSLLKIKSKTTDLEYLLLIGKLDNGNELNIRMPINPLEDSASISRKFIYILGIAAIIMGGIAIIFITNTFTEPIEELDEIAKEMAKLNFKRKYRIKDSGDEIDELGRSINILSDKLEETINELKVTNMELEKDVEEKSKIDEMRKQFISDVSHELKTPIALIQGYAEGLNENVVQDEESKKFYIEVILDEANKMDKLVKRLLELMKLEYGDRKFNDTEFDINEVINEVIKNSKVVLEENNINVEFKDTTPKMIFADDFYIEEIVMNYFTNAIKNNEEVNGKKLIKIKVDDKKDKYRISVFNTGKNIDEENLTRIWTRFYKVDKSRDRSKGGTGIGLALVKAIMTKYNNDYGVQNKKDGVEFYFEINKAKNKEG